MILYILPVMARLYLIPKANINQAANLKIGPKKKNNNIKGGTSSTLLMAACKWKKKKEKKSLFIINVSEIKESEMCKLFFAKGLVAPMESIPMLSLSC